jgi:hypothetical protein
VTETPDPTQPLTPAAPQSGEVPPPPPATTPEPVPAPTYDAAPAYAAPPPGQLGQLGPVGKVRGTGFGILLYIVTFGIYGIYWWYATHEEMKRHTNTGLGGVVALLLAIFIGIVMPYITSSEVGNLRERSGQEKRVGAATGLWFFPGALILIGPFVWFIKTNGALNDYWKSMGAPAN